MTDIYSVSRVSSYLRELIESDPLLSDLWIRGELSNWTRARSGHCYFTLKDDIAEIRCVMWKEVAQRLPVLPSDGEEVIAAGSLGIYAARGSYQFYVAEMQPVGRGILYQRFEALKAALAAEGLFEHERKRELPRYPRRIGVVTSPTAAAFQDILNVLRRRHPLVEVLLSPTLVQGGEAPDGIVRALRRFEHVPVDLVIIARGGGSIEDLWAFNEEIVARAIRDCPVPVISGVGHEIDYTIADFVADCRAPTPSVAAELAVPDIRELREYLRHMTAELHDAMHANLVARRQHLTQEVRALERVAPESRLREQRQRLDTFALRLDRAWTSQRQRQESRLDGLQGRLAALNPRATIARGYAIVSDEGTSALVRSAATVTPGQRLHIAVEDGAFPATAGDRNDF